MSDYLQRDHKILQYYLGDSYRVGDCICSPLPDRQERNPSFSTFYGENDGSILWKDQGYTRDKRGFRENLDYEEQLGSTMLHFVQHMEGCTFDQAKSLYRSRIQYNKGNINFTNLEENIRLDDVPKIIIAPKFSKQHLDFWGKINICEHTLIQEGILPAAQIIYSNKTLNFLDKCSFFYIFDWQSYDEYWMLTKSVDDLDINTLNSIFAAKKENISWKC